MKKMLFSLFAAVMAVSFIACANSSDGGSSTPEKKGSKGGDDPVVTETYTVTYDDGVANEDIAVPEDANEYEEGDTVTVKFAGIGERDYYTFTGWSDGTNTYTANGNNTFTMPADNVTLTAQWKEDLHGTSWKYTCEKHREIQWIATYTFAAEGNTVSYKCVGAPETDHETTEVVNGTYSINENESKAVIVFEGKENSYDFVYDFTTGTATAFALLDDTYTKSFTLQQ